MKQLVVLFSALILISCNKFKVEGTAPGVANGTNVFLVTSDSTGTPKPKDTVKITDGKFEFEGKNDKPEIAYVVFEKTANGNVGIILEKGTVEVNFDYKNPEKNSISGTKNNDLYQSYNNSNLDIQKKVEAIYKKNAAFMQKKPETDEEKQKAGEIMAQFQKFQMEMDKRSKDFIAKNENTFVSLLLVENLFYKNKMEASKAKEFYDGLDSDLKETASGKSLKSYIDLQLPLEKAASKKKVVNTSKAANFSAKTPEGKTVSLKDVLGKVTIIDFWASWCPPCRAENPNMVALYNELHAKGLNMIGVSLDDNLEAWKKAIAKDKLTWTQVSNLKKWKDPIALDYEIEEVPTTLVLDEKGNIVAKGLRGEELKAKVKELLGVK